LNHYRIGGLAVESAMPLRGAIRAPADAGKADVRVVFGDLPEDLPDVTARGPNWAIAGDACLLRVKGVARFLITGGREIRVELAPGETAADATVYLLGSAFGILQHQRGRMVLHASAVVVGDRAVLFCGPSGAGKSTLAASLDTVGYPCLSDDVCGIEFTGAEPVVLPDGRMLKLWADAADHLAVGERQGPPIRHDIDKYYVEPESSAAHRRLAVSAIYLLAKSPEAAPPSLVRLRGPDAALALRRNAYRPQFLRRFGLESAYFGWSAALHRQAGVFRLARPFNLTAMPGVVRALEGHWRELGLLPGGARGADDRFDSAPMSSPEREPAAELSDAAHITRAEGWLSAQSDDGVMMKGRGPTDYIGVGGAGGEIWKLLERPRTMGELCTQLAASYGVSVGDLRADVAAFIQGLAARGALLID
jgi:hypothetical protein